MIKAMDPAPASESTDAKKAAKQMLISTISGLMNTDLMSELLSGDIVDCNKVHKKIQAGSACSKIATTKSGDGTVGNPLTTQASWECLGNRLVHTLFCNNNGSQASKVSTTESQRARTGCDYWPSETICERKETTCPGGATVPCYWDKINSACWDDNQCGRDIDAS